MTGWRFDPPLAVRGFPGLLVHTLDEAERFMHEHESLAGHSREGVLRRLQVADDPASERDAAMAFKGWLEAERLLMTPKTR